MPDLMTLRHGDRVTFSPSMREELGIRDVPHVLIDPRARLPLVDLSALPEALAWKEMRSWPGYFFAGGRYSFCRSTAVEVLL